MSARSTYLYSIAYCNLITECRSGGKEDTTDLEGEEKPKEILRIKILVFNFKIWILFRLEF